ncbi:type II TA system antitoxin MqsA family protein [Eggerthella sp. YY7918]|uniref:type II TA system antitoxin MqsA family protein n=1 Tax=Eggerthella sp. (strain YY7918) TaxID=502558 RepID=UPI00021712BA|nr:type II TA system antitoxin MqsA family protein [Eggerthella sp. YY7918]BAK44191.1 uncharacterized phage-associated protein [Eggerthella sp. YY7918]
MVVKLSQCVECGAAINWIVGPIEWNVKGERITVDKVEHGICSVCGEIYFADGVSSDVQHRAVEVYKAAHGLLTGAEIRAIRQRLGLSQARFEHLIGAGPKTVVRWENGTVFQNRTADMLMRIIRDYPAVAQDLLQHIDA